MLVRADIQLGHPFGLGEEVGSLNWLPAEQPGLQVLVIGDELNRQLQLYTVERGGAAELKQTLQLEGREREASMCNAIAVHSTGALVVLANMERKAVYVLHVQQAQSVHFDCLTKYQLGWPILSMDAEADLPDGIARLYCVQTHAIQTYSLRWAECLPPAGSDQPMQQPGIATQDEVSSEAPETLEGVPSHALADSEEESGLSRPESAGSAAVLGPQELDSGLPQPPAPVTTPPAAAVPQPRLLTPKQLKQLAGSRAGSLGSIASAEGRPSGQPGGGQPFGLQRAPTPPAKPPSPALSGGPPAFGDRPPSGEPAAPDASRVPMFGGTIAGGDPVAMSQALEAAPSPAANGSTSPPVKILKRKQDADAAAQPNSEVSAWIPAFCHIPDCKRAFIFYAPLV